MRRTTWPVVARIGALVAASIIGLAACGSGGGTGQSEAGAAAGGGAGDTIKVGILHSLSGTMAISEVTVKDAELLAIEEINAAGGVLGKKLEPIVEDGASDWPTFAEKADKLITQDKVAAVFGGWTSASRKAMLPVFERRRRCCGTPSSTRAWRARRTSSTPAPPPTSRSCRRSTT